MALEVEVSRMEKSGPLSVTDGWYLKHLSTPPQLSPRFKMQRMSVLGNRWVLSSTSGKHLVIVWVLDPFFLLYKTACLIILGCVFTVEK